MFTTRDVLRLLRNSNPDATVTEERVRRALRTERAACPGMFAGRLAWSDDDVKALASCLGLRAPAPTDRPHSGERE